MQGDRWYTCRSPRGTLGDLPPPEQPSRHSALGSALDVQDHHVCAAVLLDEMDRLRSFTGLAAIFTLSFYWIQAFGTPDTFVAAGFFFEAVDCLPIH